MNTIWEPGRLLFFPGLLDAHEVTEHMRSQLRDCHVHESVWRACECRLAACDLPLMQAFAAWQFMRGLDHRFLPPALLHARTRTKIFAGNSGQRYSSEHAKGLDHLLPPGLGKAEHMRQALSLPSPFVAAPWPDDDVQFVAYTIAVWRDELPVLAQRQRHVLQTLQKSVEPLRCALHKLLCPSALKVSASKNAAFVALLTALLRWPDHGQAACFVHGFPIVGDVAFSGVFRLVDSGKEEAPESIEEWLLRDGQSAVDSLLRSPPPRCADEILEQTLQEQSKGFCSQLYTRAEVDGLFGRGRWRPMERFLLVQGDNKKRLVDNCRKTEHNLHASLSETIHTVSIDFVASCIRDTFNHLRRHDCDPSSADWLAPRLGTDDLPDAYRGHPVSEQHLPLSVVAIYVPKAGWRFTILYGLAYGLEAAVVAFNRLPLLGVAAARRCTSSMCAAYFDDELSVEFLLHQDVSRLGLHLCFRLLGSPPQPSKHFPPAANRHYLGTSVHVGAANLSLQVRFQPKFLTRCKVLNSLDNILATGTMDRDAAGKLRGDLQWLFSMVSGHAGKIAAPTLARHQKGDDPSLSHDSRSILTALRHMITHAGPRDVDVSEKCKALTTIYTDASFENNELRIGWVIFSPAPARPSAGTCVVPPEAIREWKERDQQIFIGETMAALIVPILQPHLFQGADILWFIDNSAAVSTVIKASSREDDVHEVAIAAACVRVQLGCRAWFEWIDSESNPSDGLSRLGLRDHWSCSQDWNLVEYTFPASAFRSRILEWLLQ